MDGRVLVEGYDRYRMKTYVVLRSVRLSWCDTYFRVLRWETLLCMYGITGTLTPNNIFRRGHASPFSYKSRDHIVSLNQIPKQIDFTISPRIHIYFITNGITCLAFMAAISAAFSNFCVLSCRRYRKRRMNRNSTLQKQYMSI